MPDGAGGYDWKKPTRPPAFVMWVAEHRAPVRIVLLILDVAFVAAVVVDLAVGDVWWLLYVEVVLWIGLTYQFGWGLPATADRWHAGQDHPVPD